MTLIVNTRRAGTTLGSAFSIEGVLQSISNGETPEFDPPTGADLGPTTHLDRKRKRIKEPFDRGYFLWKYGDKAQQHTVQPTQPTSPLVNADDLEKVKTDEQLLEDHVSDFEERLSTLQSKSVKSVDLINELEQNLSVAKQARVEANKRIQKMDNLQKIQRILIKYYYYDD